MKELSDEEFDALLKRKSEAFDYDFDEAAWNQMEQKLKRRDRAVFFQRASLAVILLLVMGTTGYFFLPNTFVENQKVLNPGKQTPQIELPKVKKEVNQAGEVIQAKKSKANIQSAQPDLIVPPSITGIAPQSQKQLRGVADECLLHMPVQILLSERISRSDTLSLLAISNLDLSSPAKLEILTAPSFLTDSNDIDSPLKSGRSGKMTLSITALMGPDFSSISASGGSKANLNAGILLNANLSTRIAVSTGLRYGLKDYTANAYDYQTQSPRAPYISGIEASCNILEIPMQIAYSLSKAGRRQLWVASGLSSYLMLKEKYEFHYTPQSGYKSYQLVKSNANQHYLSVLSLSASYRIQPKSSSIQWAIEPYVRLPLGGVGEGNVRLKSSGISLNLTYDLSKKGN